MKINAPYSVMFARLSNIRDMEVMIQPLKERKIRNLLGVKERPARKADDLTAICEPIV
jgi:hypothetical protein